MVPRSPAVEEAPKPMFLTTVGISSVKNTKMMLKAPAIPIFPAKARTCNMKGMSENTNVSIHKEEV